MKQSTAIETIIKYLDEKYGPPTHEEDVRDLLNFLEKELGMLPPLTTLSAFGIKDNSWDPE